MPFLSAAIVEFRPGNLLWSAKHVRVVRWDDFYYQDAI
jgi:hypothetical protein